MKLYFLILIVLLVQISLGAAIRGSEAVQIGGIKQWITFQGVNDQDPVLLFLHGGPGNSVLSYADRFTKELQKQFIVVQWDQRESGQTAVLNKSPRPLTVSIFVKDAVEVIKYLSKRFSQEKIYVAGHSWGGYVGLHVATEIPELVKGYFAVSPMIHQVESERLSLKMLKDKATREHNTKALAELNQIEIPFTNATTLYYHRKWLSRQMNSGVPTQQRVNEWASTWLAVFNEASLTNFVKATPELTCPVYFLIGGNDFQTHFSLAESYYQQVICSEKKLIWFERSAHNPHLTESVRFQQTIIDVKNQQLKSQL